jgi:hypothetical protein
VREPHENDDVVGELPLWHVTLVMSGPRVDPGALRDSLDRLVQERPLMLSVRYAADRAELSFWDEGESLDDVAALALRLWGDHRVSAGLPPWSVAGLEVLDRATMARRGAARASTPLLAAGVAPL